MKYYIVVDIIAVIHIVFIYHPHTPLSMCSAYITPPLEYVNNITMIINKYKYIIGKI